MAGDAIFKTYTDPRPSQSIETTLGDADRETSSQTAELKILAGSPLSTRTLFFDLSYRPNPERFAFLLEKST